MTRTAIILALMATNANAGGLSYPIIPDAPTPQERGWSGFYLGGVIGVHSSTQREHVGTTYVRECREGINPKDPHDNNKCAVSQYDWDNSPEIQALEHNDRPWNKDDFYRYIQPDYYGVWMGSKNDREQAVFRYTTDRDIDGPDVGKPSSNTVVDVIEYYDESSLTEASIGLFAGYRTECGPLICGVEAWGFATESTDFLTAEAQAGYAMGRTLAYVGATPDGFSVGADWQVGKRVILGIKAYDGDVMARYGWVF